MSLILRLWSKTEQKDGHWLFQGAQTRYGHGQACFNGKVEYVHRLSAHLFLGLKLRSKLQANHKVNCQYRNCWNPDHIYIGTQSQNLSDRAPRAISSLNYWQKGMRRK